MTKQEKKEVIEKLVSKFTSNNAYYFTDTSAFTVDVINNFRRLCFKKGFEYYVAKNTLIKKALQKIEMDSTAIQETLIGSTGILFSKETPSLPAKMLIEFAKGGDVPKLKGAIINQEQYPGADQLKALSEIKSKEDLLGEIIQILQSPIQNVVGALQSGQNNLSGIIKTLSQRSS